MQYTVLIEEKLVADVVVDAEDIDHAIALAMESYYACEIVLGSENFVGVSFSIKEDKRND